MASSTLYPPNINTYVSAFDGNSCTLYYSLSKVNMDKLSDIKGIHVSVIQQDSGRTVVNTGADSSTRFRKAGILIINERPQQVPGEENLFQITINADDIKNGWQNGWIYKFQVRLSSEQFPGGTTNQADWTVRQGSSFSEWSTYCTSKKIGKSTLLIPTLGGYNSGDPKPSYTLPETIEINGSYSNEDSKELLYSYQIEIYDDRRSEVVEKSDVLYTNQYYGANKIYYLSKYPFEDNDTGRIVIKYTTINKFEQTLTIPFKIDDKKSENTNLTFEIIEEGIDSDEGRVHLNISGTMTSGSVGYYIKRASGKDNFATYEIVGYKSAPGTFYDYTIESGVLYKYMLQEVDASNKLRNPTPASDITYKMLEYSYLLGADGKQLKLNLSPSVNSYGYSIAEGKIETIGGKFPFVNKNGNMKYRSLPISAMISYNMDDQNTFTSEDEMYRYNDVIVTYHNYHNKVGMYDYKKEFDFREKVLEFLQDGKPKLFKSSTEGNIIVRLTGVSTSPNQSLNRMIGTMSCTAVEVAEATVDNYLKYNFFKSKEA